MLNTLFMELVKALIDGAAKKGLMMTASQPLLHQHWILHKYVEHTYIHIWNTNTFTLNENTVTCKYIHNHGHPFYIYETFIFVANYMSSTLHPCL